MEIPQEILEKLKILNELEKNGFEPILSVEKCFGACDVRENEAKLLKCDAILHIGHERFLPKSKVPVVYWEYFMESDPLPILEKELEKLKDFEKIGLITSIQFVKLLPRVEEFLKKRGKKVFIHKALQYPGQVLGCDLRAAKAIEKKVDCFLAISAGEFYAAGLVLQTEKPVLNLDLERREIRNLEEFKKKVQKIVVWNKAQLKDAKRIGLIVSWKKGQLKLPFELKKRLEAKGKEVYILAMDEVTPEKIEGLELDFLINFACPRIAIDDQAKYPIPILNYDQLNSKRI